MNRITLTNKDKIGIIVVRDGIKIPISQLKEFDPLHLQNKSKEK